MDAVARNLRTLIAIKQTTQAAVGAVAGVSEGAVSAWITGRNEPRIKNLEKISDYYGVTVDDLRSESNGLYARFYGLESAPAGALAVAPSSAKDIPVQLVGSVHAGSPDDGVVETDSYPLPERIWQNHKSCYALQVRGDCMDNVFTESSVIFVDPDLSPSDGSIGVFLLDGSELVVRRMRRGANTLLLSPDSHNPSWSDIVIQGDFQNVVCKGVVFWFQTAAELR